MSKITELQRRLEAGDPEAIQAVAQSFSNMGRILTEWLETIRPALEKMTEIMNQPDVRAALEETYKKG